VLRAIVQSLKILTIGMMALLIATGGRSAFDFAVDNAADDDVGRPVRIEIGEDDDAAAVAETLENAGLIKSKVLFQAQLRLNSGVLVPGPYTLRKGLTVEEIVDRITGVVTEEPEAFTFEMTIPEGWRLGQIAELAEEEGLDGGYDAFVKAAEEFDGSRYGFLEDRPEGASLEGYLFPDTYTFVSDNPTSNIETMLNNFDAKVTPDLRARAREMGLTLHEVITLASIVEREAQVAEERPIIAAAYLNRIEQGIDLEADPTISYVLGERGNWWEPPTFEQLEQTDSPYNTYLNNGLPPGPIANPSLASIQAVLVPADVTYIYFVAKGDDSGEHAFATTPEEHNENLCTYGYPSCVE
jgi:UPF0755 protein